MSAKVDCLFVVRNGVGYAIVSPPVPCACGRMVAFVVNRNGKTRCVECDAVAEPVR